MYSIVRGDLRADICSDERSLVTRPTRSHALQHHAFSHDVLRHDADRSHSEPVLPRHGHRGRRVALHHSSLSVNLLQPPCHYCRHQLLHTDISLRRCSTSHRILSDTGELLPNTGESYLPHIGNVSNESCS